MKKIITLILVLILIISLSACSGSGVQSATAIPSSLPSNPAGIDALQNSATSTISVKYDSDDLDSSLTGSGMSYIVLEGNSIKLEGDGATVEGNMITITSAGTYSISGILNDGQIRVNTGDKAVVKLVLNGADIACLSSAPIYIISAEKTVITLADGKENHVEDGANYIFEDAESDEPDAAIFSHDDLTINGNGSLTVTANYNNGIRSKDDLKIVSGNITVAAVNDGIKGRDELAVKGGNITVSAGGDGLQSNNDEDTAKGYVFIDGGCFNITAGTDGIQAETSLLVSGGNITISSGGGSINSSSNFDQPGNTWGKWGMKNNSDVSAAASAKGLKAGVDIAITGGTIKIDSSDDSIHSNSGVKIDSGDITLVSGDDGVHADATIQINGGDINITKCYEGIESAVVTINKGNIHIVSNDDGINIVGGNDGSAMMGRPGQNEFVSSDNNYLDINGGYIVVHASGDGLDINGPINMTGGKVIINGPTANDNGALDYAGSFNIRGGYLIATGSAGMPQAPSTSSTQYSVMLNLESSQPASTMVHIETKEGNEVLTFMSAKAYQSVVFSSPELKNSANYIVYIEGSSTGSESDGIYSGGVYTDGTQITSFTVSGMVTTISSSRVSPGAGGRNNMPPGMHR